MSFETKFQIGTQFLVNKNNGETFIGTVVAANKDTSEVELIINRIIYGDIIDSYDEKVIVGKTGTFSLYGNGWKFTEYHGYNPLPAAGGSNCKRRVKCKLTKRKKTKKKYRLTKRIY